MDKKLNTKVEEMKKEIVKTTQDIVRIKSVKSEEKEGMPFGYGVNKCLDAFLERAEKMGMKTKNVEGYAGHVEIGQGEKILGILCHLDVVPEGNDWTYPPYEAEIHDNKIYGRGTIDDKGPAVAALYALKAVKDRELKLNKRIRLILGTNEETGCKGLKHYLNREEEPAFSFSPDANFPVIHAEKGIIIFDLQTKFSEQRVYDIESIKGGNAPNMVPDYCQAVINLDNNQQLEKDIKENLAKCSFDIKLEKNDNKELIIKSYGKSAHGSTPEKGQNAISQLMVFLNELSLVDNEITKFIDTYNKKINMEYNGESIGCYLCDDVSGKLIFNVGMINVDKENAEITINIRYPVKNTKKGVIKSIKKNIKDSSLELKEAQHMEPLFVPKDDKYIKKLMSVYRSITGDDSEPIAIGGGTYARRVKKGVAFGCVFPGQPKLAHQKDEYIDIDSLIKSTKIYAVAIKELAT